MSKEFEDLERKFNDFLQSNLEVTYKFNEHEVICVDQYVLDRLKPPRTYPNPNFNISKINTILGLIELHRECNCPKMCPLYETKRLRELLERFVKNPKTMEDEIVERIIDKLRIRDEKFQNEYLGACQNCGCNCRNQCKELLDELQEDDKRFEMTKDEFKCNKEVLTVGLYLTKSRFIYGVHYRKGSILIGNDIPVGSDEFALTYVHENTHALLDDLFGSKVHTKKGFNEGFAVAMEFFYADEYDLDFNKERHGEYLAHEILTLPKDKSILKRTLDSVSDKL